MWPILSSGRTPPEKTCSRCGPGIKLKLFRQDRRGFISGVSEVR